MNEISGMFWQASPDCPKRFMHLWDSHFGCSDWLPGFLKKTLGISKYVYNKIIICNKKYFFTARKAFLNTNFIYHKSVVKILEILEMGGRLVWTIPMVEV